MIELPAQSYVLGFWYVAHDPCAPVRERIDWFCGAWIEPGRSHYTIKWRLRRCLIGEFPFAAAHTGWYVSEIAATGGGCAGQPAAWLVCTGMAEMMAEKNRTAVSYLPVKADSEKAHALLASVPWGLWIGKRQDDTCRHDM